MQQAIVRGTIRLKKAKMNGIRGLLFVNIDFVEIERLKVVEHNVDLEAFF